MKAKITILFIFLLTVTFSYGQQKKSSSSAKNFGVGLKIGDPLGFSLKKYMGNNKALELIIGRSTYFGGYNHDYYYEHSDHYRNNPNYYLNNNYNYRGGPRSQSFPFALQFRYLAHKDIKGVDGLQWFAGAGIQFRYQRFEYYYEYRDQFGIYRSGFDRVVDYGIGPDIIGGVEYTFEDVPISISADLNLYIEIVDRPFYLLLQGGITGRYNF